MDTIDVKVVRKSKEAQDIVSFDLARLDGTALPAFSAGAHIDVHLGQGLVRQYSLCNDILETNRYQIAVLRDPNSRGGSAAMHERVREGDVLRISAPRNHFPLVPAKRSLLFAGGIGVTPIICMAEYLARCGADFEVYYCTRELARTAFFDRLNRSSFLERVHFHFDSGPGERRLDLPSILAGAEDDAHLYVCGPTGFIEHVSRTASLSGWSPANIHSEHFGASQLDSSGDIEFQVKLASTGECYPVPPGKTVAQVLDSAGIFIPVSCEQGVCGTCITPVLDGTPDHRDVYLTDEEKAANRLFTPCCSRAKSGTLVLDL